MLCTEFYFISNVSLSFLSSLIILTLVLISVVVSLVVQIKSIISLIVYTCSARDKACEHDALLCERNHFVFNLFVHRLNINDE